MKRCSLYADTAGHCCPGKTKCAYAEQSRKPGKAKEIALATAAHVALLALACGAVFVAAATYDAELVSAARIDQEVINHVHRS